MLVEFENRNKPKSTLHSSDKATCLCANLLTSDSVSAEHHSTSSTIEYHDGSCYSSSLTEFFEWIDVLELH